MIASWCWTTQMLTQAHLPAGGARAITQEAKVGMAKEIFGNGEAIRGVKLLQEVYFEDPSSSNAITLGVFAKA